MTLISTPLWASNSATGQLTRVVCFQTDVQGDAAKRRNDFIVILQQASVAEFDASYYVQGNDNYDDTILVRDEEFIMHVYHRPEGVDLQQDPRVIADNLLAEEPSIPPVSTNGIRNLDSFQFRVGRQPSLVMSTNRLGNQFYLHGAEHRYLSCEAPYGVPDPSAVEVVEEAYYGDDVITEDAEETAVSY
jgi:hypothetical protein